MAYRSASAIIEFQPEQACVAAIREDLDVGNLISDHGVNYWDSDMRASTSCWVSFRYVLFHIVPDLLYCESIEICTSSSSIDILKQQLATISMA